MAPGQPNRLLDHLRRTALVGAGPTDAELLDCFLARRDESAFAALVRRHGPMVLGVCRRILRNEADSEDAFQAVFLVLVRRASSVQPKAMVGNFLYGVAFNTARKLRAMNSKRRDKERQAAQPDVPTRHEADDRLLELLDEELHRLPESYRVPIVLCDLEGKPIKEAARQLGWPQGTVASRLARGRILLARRLTGKGLALSGGALGTTIAQQAQAAVPPVLLRTTVQTALWTATGQATAGAISAQVATLTEGVLKAMFLTKLKTVTFGLTLIAALGLGGGGLLYQSAAQEPTKKPARVSDTKVTKVPTEAVEGDKGIDVKLPPGARTNAQLREQLEASLQKIKELEAALAEEARRQRREEATTLDDVRKLQEEQKMLMEQIEQAHRRLAYLQAQLTSLKQKDARNAFEDLEKLCQIYKQVQSKGGDLASEHKIIAAMDDAVRRLKEQKGLAQPVTDKKWLQAK
jgi:RNA polymerase sigma factor (sigma-70 family)